MNGDDPRRGARYAVQRMKNVIDMEGGFTEWRIQDLPVDYLS